ncbi:hypothetical protein N0V95_009924 [Ascochyta clinopodiicola]|nr:hypothetical protein N0V95_009924 [Ascochyta clinopodiicola]
MEISQVFLESLDNHISRVTAKWKEEGVQIAVINIAAWFNYGENLHILRQLFLLRAVQRKNPDFKVEDPSLGTPRNPDLQKPKLPEREILAKVSMLNLDAHFSGAVRLTNEAFTIALRRVGDENVLPQVHVMLAFLSTFASVECIAHLVAGTPWTELVAFLNVLINLENQKALCADCICQPVFSTEQGREQSDDLILPEDYLIRGLIWAEEYLPPKWFEKGREEEERYLELDSTAKIRSERVLRLGFKLSQVYSSKASGDDHID